ncbi:MAG: DEAD/DEAH box helicase [Planctomycetota bacterium]
MDVVSFLARVQAGRHYQGQIAAVRVIAARPPRFAKPGTSEQAAAGGHQDALPAALQELLKAEEIEELYAHQARAYDAIRAGRDVVIATGTASGKSLCYHLPVLAEFAEEPAGRSAGAAGTADTASDCRALYLYPAKALAYDQLGGLQRMVAAAGLAEAARPACYDGDTPTHKRAGVRRTATIILSNPDMLHQSILPYHAKWAGFLARLRFVVLDEIHMYRGIFGSHVAGVVRRLQRLCTHYGGTETTAAPQRLGASTSSRGPTPATEGRRYRPQFICCSATVGNPRELAERLIGRPVELIDEDGSPRGRRYFVLWNPPWVEERGTQSAKVPGLEGEKEADANVNAHSQVPTFPRSHTAGTADQEVGRYMPVRVYRRSANAEALELLLALLEEGAGTIAFCKARVVAELIYKYATEALKRRRSDLVRRIQPYRGGYLPNERREIERKLFNGELLGVCSTNALELGIDVGSLDAALIVGFPGTLCSLWQQAGRAGRRRDDSLAIYIAYDDPVDQYLMRNPGFVFGRPVEHAIIDPENPHILAAQLGCAAFELPLGAEDLAAFGPVARDVAEVLADEGRLRLTGGTAIQDEGGSAVKTHEPDTRGGARYYWASADFPAAQTNLRTISNATFAILDITAGRNTVIGQVDSISAPELVYPEAIYMHQGESYLVRELDLPARLARVERLDADYYTQPVLADECRLGTQRLAGETPAGHVNHGANRGRKFFGDVMVKWQTIAFRKFKLYSMELIGQTALNLPAQEVHTTGLWLQPPEHALAAAREESPARVHEALAGVRNLLVVALPPLAMCDRHDIGGIVNYGQLGVGTIVLYDRYEGGVGYARHGFEACDELLRLAWELARSCKCADGCPGCVAPPNLHVPIHHDPDLGGGYAIPDKRATMRLLGAWLG